MSAKKYKITKRQVEMLAEAEINKLRGGKTNELEGLETMAGKPEDRRIEYPSLDDRMEIDMDLEPTSDEQMGDVKPDVDQSLMKSPPHELLEYLDKIEEAKSILSKIAARETDENIKARVYVHYEKAQKLAFELIKEFGVVH